MAVTLERVVKYDVGAFQRAWDFLASSPSDGEDDYIYIYIYFFFSFFSPILSSPWERGEVRPFWGRLILLRPFGRMVQAPAAKKVSTIKTPKKSAKSRKTDRTPLRARTILDTPTYSTEEASGIYRELFLYVRVFRFLLVPVVHIRANSYASIGCTSREKKPS